MIAPNAFKGTLSASQAAYAIAKRLRSLYPGVRFDFMPISDGGDGLAEVLQKALGGKKVYRVVLGPMGRPHRTYFLYIKERKTAVVEMALASGLTVVTPSRRNPLKATSYGVGQLISEALSLGAKIVLIGLGGSATSDGGAGMAQALGAGLFDLKGRKLDPGAEPLLNLSKIVLSGLNPKVKNTRFIGVTDVRNPLLGPKGSASVYGPQKGASPSQVRILEKALRRYREIIRKSLGKEVNRPGAGAAGGLGAGLLAFLDAKLVPGADFVLNLIGAERRVRKADLAATGEGKFDSQSFFGKAPYAFAGLALKNRKKVVLVCGRYEPSVFPRLKRLGIEAFTLRSPGVAYEA